TLSLVVEVGAFADPLQVFQGERRPAVGHEPATSPCDIVRTHHRRPGSTWSFRFAAGGHRQPDEITNHLQGLAVLPVVPDEPFFQCWVVAGVPGVAEDDALDAGHLAFGPPEAEVSCDVLEAVRVDGEVNVRVDDGEDVGRLTEERTYRPAGIFVQS